MRDISEQVKVMALYYLCEDIWKIQALVFVIGIVFGYALCYYVNRERMKLWKLKLKLRKSVIKRKGEND